MRIAYEFANGEGRFLWSQSSGRDRFIANLNYEALSQNARVARSTWGTMDGKKLEQIMVDLYQS